MLPWFVLSQKAELAGKRRLAMDQTLEQPDSSGNKTNGKVLMGETDIGEKTNECNRCDFVSSFRGNLKRHVKTHSGEKPKNATNVTLHQFIQAI